MRVTNNMMLRNTTSNINNNKYSVNSLNNQMSSQKKISRPSEDPVVAIRALRLRSNLSEINQYYEKNIPDADAWLDVTETALKNMKTILSDIRTQCTYGASDQLKAEDRKTILTQLESLRKQIYSEGNSDYAGRTVFTGYRTNCKLTFMEDESNTEYNIQQKFSYEDIGEHRYYDGQVELKTAEEMRQKVTTSDTKQYTYDRIRLAYGDIGSLKDKDGNEIAAGAAGTLSYHYTDNAGTAKTGDLNVTVYETEDDWKKAVKAGNMPEVICGPTPASNKVVVIRSSGMGEGDPELGKVLLKGFIYAISQQKDLPKTMLFYYGGAFITCEGSQSLEDLKALEEQGVKILTCGTCLNHYGLTDRRAVGEVTNMYEIAEKMTQASLIVSP